MKYDFSTPDKRQYFVKTLQYDHAAINEPLPNFSWISHTEFVHHGFFMYSDWQMFTRAFGGPNRLSNTEQLPESWPERLQKTIVYAKCFIITDMCGYVLLPCTQYKKCDIKEKPYYGWKGKLFIGKFRFCVHEMVTKNIGKCLNEHTCRKCGFKATDDSSG